MLSWIKRLTNSSDWRNTAPFKCIENGKTGFLASDTDDWARCIKTLVEDKGLREEMGSLARDKVREEFNISDIAKKYESILEGYV